MNFVLTTIGSAGDVFPMMGLALELQQRGHRVALVTNDYFAPLAARQGISFEALGSAEDYLKCIRNPDLWNPHKAFRHVYEMFHPLMPRQHEIVVEHAKREPTVCIASCLCFGARVAQESHAVPVLTVHLQPAVIWSDVNPPLFANLMGPLWLKRLIFRFGERFVLDRIIGPYMNQWRKGFGLAPIRRTTQWWNSPTGILCLFPDWYAAPQIDWPSPLIQTDFPLWNEESNVPLPEDVEQFLSAGDPPIVFTPGTANVHGREFFEAAVEGCHSLKRRGIFLTRYLEQIPAGLPSSVRHFSYVPLDLLLARSAAFVHHGGVGSTSQAMMAGIPQLIRPLAHDQFDNADRVQRMGIGSSIPVKSFTARNLANRLQSLLDSNAVMAACQDVQQRLQDRTGLSCAADAIESRFCTDKAALPA